MSFVTFVLILLAVLYFLPAIIAQMRGHKNVTPIILVNLFLGWTFLGWVGALAWSVSN